MKHDLIFNQNTSLECLTPREIGSLLISLPRCPPARQRTLANHASSSTVASTQQEPRGGGAQGEVSRSDEASHNDVWCNQRASPFVSCVFKFYRIKKKHVASIYVFFLSRVLKGVLKLIGDLMVKQILFVHFGLILCLF